MKVHRSWLALAVLLIAAGTVGSVFGVSVFSRLHGRASRQAFEASAQGIASVLKLSIQRQQDLAISAGAFFSDDPGATQAQFLQWTKAEGVLARYPQLQTLTEVRLVTAAELPAYAAFEIAHPSGLLDNGGFTPFPAGSRPYYCFAAASMRRTNVEAPVGTDYCQTWLGPQLLKARDSGQSTYVPYKSGKVSELAIGSAIYRGGVVPATVAARRADLIGWIGIASLPGIMLHTALIGHPSTAVAFEFGAGSSKAVFKAGTVPPGAASTTIALANGWRVEVFSPVTGGGLLANANTDALLASGIALSLVLGLLMYVLGTGRARALAMVHERTEELHYQAFHDVLTGLPNRALIFDRIGQMLVRARRDHATVGVLFLDLDNFKDINDRLGHSAGDELLVKVGDRLAGALREGDTVGRLGGDEFVVLSDGDSRQLAFRILAALEPPFQIPSSHEPLRVTTSIGVATGDRPSPEELLRDADIALYRAKAAGKHSVEFFARSMQESVDSRHSPRHGVARRTRGRAVLPALPALHPPGERRRDRRRGPAALAPSHARRAGAERVHSCPRSERSHRAGRAVGARVRVPAGGAMAAPGPPAAGRGERRRPAAAARPVRGRRPRRPRCQRARSRAADSGGHGEHLDAEPRRHGVPAPAAQGVRCAAVDRRLRHRILFPGLRR
jgi:diguanylate cyclase (GGDEF)-like protein